MTDINTEYKKIQTLTANDKIADAFKEINKISEKYGISGIKKDFENIKEIYRYFLEYKIKNIKDPESENIYINIKRKLFEISDRLKSEYHIKYNTKNKLYIQKKLLAEQINNENISPATELLNLINCNSETESAERKDKLHKLFFIIWLSDYFSEEDYLTLKKNTLSKKITTHETCVTVSAVTVSLLNHFDKYKFYALFDFYDTDKHEVWHRALTGIILAFYLYNDRINLYPDIISRLKSVSKDDGISEYVKDIILQIIRTKETEKISDELKNEIIPEMQKFRPKIQDKLNLDDIISESFKEDFNPDWEEIFDDAPELLDKMAEFSKKQIEGSDVFMSAFAQFKNFPFFRQTANWFMPFYKENSDIPDNFEDLKIFTEGLERSAYMCNSDKYSFCFNLGMMPPSQRKMIAELFKAESEQLGEIAKEDKLLNKKNEDRIIFTAYLQDLYRFYKLHPLKNDFEDIFALKLDIHNTELFKILIKDKNITEKIAELYFKKEFFEDAAEIFEKISFKDINKEEKKLEKTGFCFQKLKKYDKALEYYKKAEIIKDDSPWLIKKIAFCNKKLNNYKEALKYYLIAEKYNEKDLAVQANTGHCYLALEDYENALKKYFKVEYYDPDNKSVMRPLAWCSFLVGKFDTAEEYYKKLINDKPSAYDYINYGHLLFVKNKKTEAAEMYVKAAEISGINTVEDAITEDIKILKKFKINKNDINLIIDFVKIKYISSSF